jgi:hypothetical protein
MIQTLLADQDTDTKVQQIAARLLAADGWSEEFATETQEEYDLLFEAVDKGRLSGDFTIGRSGLWLNKKRVHPPRTWAAH